MLRKAILPTIISIALLSCFYMYMFHCIIGAVEERKPISQFAMILLTIATLWRNHWPVASAGIFVFFAFLPSLAVKFSAPKN